MADTLTQAASHMRFAGRILDGDELVGIVSMRDLLLLEALRPVAKS
jgi:hypothetical protein